MTPVVATKIKEEPLLISSNHFWDPQVTNFILCRQFNWPLHIQLRCWGRLSTVAWYEASTHIIWKPNKPLWRFRTLLFSHPKNKKQWDPTKRRKVMLLQGSREEGSQGHLIGQDEKPRCFINLCQDVPECCPPFISSASCRNNNGTPISANRSFRYLQTSLH